MPKSKVSLTDWLRSGLIRISRLHFFLAAAYGTQIIVYDAWDVLTPEAVMMRWLAVGGLIIMTAAVWYIAHNRLNKLPDYKRLTFVLILADVAFAAFNVYVQRGMASRAVLLFILPVVVASLLLSRAAAFATAAFSAVVYVITAVVYFTLHFNEGFKTELYAETLFYSFTFFFSAAILSVVVRFGGSTNDA